MNLNICNPPKIRINHYKQYEFLIIKTIFHYEQILNILGYISSNYLNRIFLALLIKDINCMRYNMFT